MVCGNDSRPENDGPGVKSRHEGSSDKDAADAVNVIGKSGSSDISRNRTPAVATPADRSGEQQQHHRLLLCCVCQEQSTTYRYEVVYKSAGVTASSDDPAISPPGPGSPVIAGFFPGPRPICYSSDDSRFLNGGQQQQQQQFLLSRSLDQQDDNCYYNFPVRHPRHGHLRWAVPPGPQSTSALADGAFDGTFDGTFDLGGTVACAAPSYPDYPVHIRTTTLKRVVVSSLNRSKKNSPIKRTLQEIEVTTTNQGLNKKSGEKREK